MTVFEIGTLSLAALSALFGGSFFAKYISHQKAEAVTDYRLKKAEEELKEVQETVADLVTKNTAVQTKVENFERYLNNLNEIPGITKRLDDTVAAVKTLHEIVMTLAAQQR